jgi:nicotinamidase-related amidase
MWSLKLTHPSEKRFSNDSKTGSGREKGPGALLRPDNCALVLIDYQSRFASTIDSIRMDFLVKNAIDLAKTAKIFNVPTILTTIGAKEFGGSILPQIQEIFPDLDPIDRSTMNLFEDPAILMEMEKAGRSKLMIAGLWTDFCVGISALQALREGFGVYVVVDASGDVSLQAHEKAIQQMTRAGVVPKTWLQVLLELQSDMPDQENYDLVLSAAKEHARIYGLNLYASPLSDRASAGKQGREISFLGNRTSEWWEAIFAKD